MPVERDIGERLAVPNAGDQHRPLPPYLNT